MDVCWHSSKDMSDLVFYESKARSAIVHTCRLIAEHDTAVKSGTQPGKEKMRALYERALSAGGLHLAEGSQLWAAARYGISNLGFKQ